jgi:hypothetical protein
MTATITPSGRKASAVRIGDQLVSERWVVSKVVEIVEPDFLSPTSGWDQRRVDLGQASLTDAY